MGPTQVLLHRMPAINKFIVHPPLPLDNRQAMQLLTILTSSFRRSLDSSHGFDPQPESGRSRKDGTKPPPSSALDSGMRPTDQHMQRLLTNPLFVRPSASRGEPDASKDPMAVFDRAVAKGMMNTRAAYGCLEAKLREITRSDVPDLKEGMKNSGAGLKVLKWLVSSGTANNNEFLRDTPFTKTFFKFVVAEDLQEVVWTWVERDFVEFLHRKEEEGVVGAAHHHANALFMHLARAETRGNRLDPAYSCLSRAADFLRKSSCSPRKFAKLLGPTTKLLFRVTLSRTNHPVASGPAFDAFLKLAPELLKNNSNYVYAYLNLLHPDRPSAEPALKYFKQLDAVAPQTAPLKLEFQAEDIRLGLSTARHLLQQGDRLADAQWVMQYLQDCYPKQFGLVKGDEITKTQAEEKAKSEAVTLQLLESLSLA